MREADSLNRVREHRLLGIVVPVFNTEDRYLLNCLESLCQDNADYCVALVDDGSKGRTAQLCSAFAEAHGDTFVYLRQNNAGQNAARNTGWRALAAAYTLFVDSDDVLAEGSINVLCDLLTHYNPDVLRFGFKVCADIGDRPKNVEGVDVIQIHHPARGALIANQCSLWGVAIATPQLNLHPLVEGFHIGEDLASIVPILADANSIVDVGEKLYGYVQRPSSVIQAKRHAFPLEILKAFERFDELGISSEWYEEIEWQAIKHLLYWEPLRILKSGAPAPEARKALFGYVNERFPNWKDNPYLKREKSSFGPDFKMLLSGHWGFYRIFESVKSRIAGEQEGGRQ